MDPDAALTIIRAEVHEILFGDKPDPVALAEAAEGLDAWLSSRGYLPKAWAR